MFTKELLDEWFYYEDGELFWRKNPCNWIKIGEKAGSVRKDGYVISQIRGVKFLLHRAIFLMHHGYLPELIDHIDQNPSNNKIENLRKSNKRDNANNTKLPSNNKSGTKGVSWDKTNEKWTVRFKLEGRYLFCGYFLDISDAINKRKQMEEKYG